MAGPSVDQLVAILTANPSPANQAAITQLRSHPEQYQQIVPSLQPAYVDAGGGRPALADGPLPGNGFPGGVMPTNIGVTQNAPPPIAWDPITRSYTTTPGSGSMTINPDGTMSPYGGSGGGGAAPLPGPAAPAPLPGPSTTQPPLMTPGAGEMNVPYGADYFGPILDAYMRMLMLGQQDKQFQQQSLFNAGGALAGLYAQGPYSAAELAFRNAGMGLPAIGGNAANAASLIRASTQGGTGTNNVTMGGQGVDIPSTLGGQALQRLRADPNAAGVIASFAKAAGVPDLFARSIQALIPSGFTTVGAGV